MKPILKAILLYTTLLSALIYIASVDSLSLQGVIIGGAIVASLIVACMCQNYSYNDIYTITGNKIFKNIDD